MIVLDVLGYFNRNKQNSYAALNLNQSKHAGRGVVTASDY